MSHPSSERSASRGKAKGRATPARARAVASQAPHRKRGAGREKLADILRSAENRAQVLASFRLEFEAPGAAQAFNRELTQLKRDDRQFSKHLRVHKAGQSFHIFYSPHAENISALPGRELARRSMGELVRRGELLRAVEFADALGVTKQAVSKALRDNRVFTIEFDGAQYYPSFYLDSHFDRRQLERITKTLGDLPGPSKLQFFSTPKHSLGGATPLKALAKGKFEQVKASAQGFAER